MSNANAGAGAGPWPRKARGHSGCGLWPLAWARHRGDHHGDGRRARI